MKLMFIGMNGEECMDITEEEKRKIIALISALQPHVKIYLFGSRARGDYSRGSDVDIALDGGRRIERVDVGEVRDVLNETNMLFKFDVVDFHAVQESMRGFILKEGILWKG